MSDDPRTAPERPRDLRPADRGDLAAVRQRLERAVLRARIGLFWEQLWPAIALPLVVAGIFLTLSWAGLWLILPDLPRLMLVGLFALAVVAALWPARRLRWPSRTAALARIDRASGYSHRAAATLEDRLAGEGRDAGSQTLWRAHRERLAAALGRPTAGVPSPRLDMRDPWAIRLAVVLALVVTFIAAGDDRTRRIAAAFAGPEAVAAIPARFDAWVDPPPYTGRPPVFLTGPAPAAGDALSVPQGSVVIVRVTGNGDVGVKAGAGEGGEEIDVAAEPVGSAGGDTLEHRFTLERDSQVRILRDGDEAARYAFTVQPDLAPTIRFTDPPRELANGALELSYEVSDDYGVASADVEFQPLEAVSPEGARPLVAPPQMPLALPQGRHRSGEARTHRDLTSHPWAGAKVALTLHARDVSGREGRSETREVVLPERPFSKPLARAVVSERRRLALDANAAPRVARAIEAITLLAPEDAIPSAGVYLGLTTAYYRLVRAAPGDDETLRSVVDLLWDIALSIEDGDLSDAQRALNAARERLRRAIERGAPDEEIRRLTEELRQAMNDYLRELARQAERNPQQAMPPDSNMRTLSQRDLDRMLDRIEELARTGSREAAQELLSQLDRMLSNLQAMRPPPGGQQGQSALDQLGDMIRRQQELMDRTFRMTPEGGQQGEGSQDQLDQLGGDQQSLADALRELQRQLEALGMGQPGQQGQEGQQGQQGQQGQMGQQGQGGQGQEGDLGRAGRSMQGAARALREGRPGDAIGDQAAALEALRQGARQLAERMYGQGRPTGPGVRQAEDMDPLGRPQRSRGPDFGTSVRVPDEIDTQRAREILEEIRRRLGDRQRMPLELHYLERLIDRF